MASHAGSAPAATLGPISTSELRTDVAAAPPLRASTASHDSEVARLDAEADSIFNRKRELEEVRSLNIRLSTALHLLHTNANDKSRAAAVKALEAYQESPAVHKLATVALTLNLAACGSLSGEVRALNEEERKLSERIAVLQEARKANIHLATQIHTLERDRSARAQTAVSTAREEYARAKSRAD